jgi:xanthine dehydrogenase accessory factor
MELEPGRGDDFYAALASAVSEGDPVAVATIVDVKGSVPREVGAKMLIHPLGRNVGTVGGGCGEADVMRTALDVIASGTPQLVHVDLTEDITMQALGVCGGTMDVFVGRVDPAPLPGIEPDGSADLIAALRHSAADREPVALVTVVTGARPGQQAVVWLDKPPLGGLGLGEGDSIALQAARLALEERQHKLVTLDAGDATIFVEVQQRAPELVIVGAGHIGVPLAQVGAMCGFSVTVLDDRPGYVTSERFPTAERRIAAPLRETVRELAIDADTYVVLVTRGHSHDVECLLEVLDRPAAYIGMIGSQRRVDAVFELLENEMGIAPEKFDRVYAPIGLAIGARTPAEIAVCIMAEVINVHRHGPAVSISSRRRDRDRKRRESTR